MYWNLTVQKKERLITELNSNIRCIEIFYLINNFQAHHGWIVTLDVLKSLNDMLISVDEKVE